jgi:hypothetical protein
MGLRMREAREENLTLGRPDGEVMMRSLRLAAVALLLLIASRDLRAETWALKGTALTPDAVIDDAVVVLNNDVISEVGKDARPPGGAPVISPTALAARQIFSLRSRPSWEGATSVTGSLIGRTLSDRTCVIGLARNLDHEAGLPKKTLTTPCPGTPPLMVSAIANEVFPMEIPHDRLDWYRCELQQGTLRALLVHLGEGKPKDASAHREFRMLKAQGMLQPGLVIIGFQRDARRRRRTGMVASQQ